MIRVFRMNDCEWWAGEGSVLDILLAYMHETGVDLEDSTSGFMDFPSALSEEDMLRMKFRKDHDDGSSTTITFRDELNDMIERGCKFPCFFASTEC